MNYTRREKASAVRLYVKFGADHAAAVIGCNPATIYRWLSEVEADPKDERQAQHRQATAERLAEKRKALCEALADTALDLTVAARTAKPTDAKNLMIAAGIASQRHLELLPGAQADDPNQIPSRAKVQGWISRLDRPSAVSRPILLVPASVTPPSGHGEAAKSSPVARDA